MEIGYNSWIRLIQILEKENLMTFANGLLANSLLYLPNSVHSLVLMLLNLFQRANY